ncbi:hypothetical protein CQZ98_26895 [Pseudomonas sp. MYb115]|nr:hypothetical protein CQZ98_26895 [Pseudomonas sp. MYb115]
MNAGVSAKLEVSDGAGNWLPVAQGSQPGGLLDLLGLFSGAATSAKIEGLGSGEYRFTLSANPTLVGVLTSATAKLSVDSQSLTDFDVTAARVTGNVIIDNGVDGTPDNTGIAHDATVAQVNGQAITPIAGESSIVQGLYGSLTISADGTYKYTPDAIAANVGKVDSFAYTLTTPGGGTASANLYVRIGSVDSSVTWSPTDPSAPGTVTVVATDDIGTAQIDLVPPVVETELNDITYSPPVIGSRTKEGDAFTVAADTSVEVAVSRSFVGLGVLPTTTIVLEKWDGSTWKPVPGQTTNDPTHTFTISEAGDYRVTSTTGALVSAGTITVTQTLHTTLLTEFVTGPVTAATGNVLALSDHSAADSLGSTLTVLSVLVGGAYVIPGQTGAVVHGQYGTLTLHADGDYSYVPNAGLPVADIGKVDSFTYKLTTPGGQEDTATLYVRLDSPDVDLVWDDAHPGNPGTEALGFAAASFEQTSFEEQSSHATITEGANGDDHIAIHDTEFAAVDGGDGFDTLAWDGGDATINLSLLVGKVSDIESIDLNDFSAVNLTLSLEDLVAVTAPETDRLFIQGDEQDSVQLTGNWSVGATQLENGQEYVVYTSQEDETHQLWVQSGVNVV